MESTEQRGQVQRPDARERAEARPRRPADTSCTTSRAAAALGQIAFARPARAVQLRLGFALMAAGLVVLPVAALLPSLWLFLVGSVVAGTGLGLGFRASVATVAALAEPALAR
ncbi:hypothetical protein [Amycolatopsis sp. FDAARGOS 1241]|uniref:hypothetical protein n=1 Tax=Amycolatopsis sp. FDAARGOS 1241 TaxID=2778070 RepID=UPI001EF16302|nr:hypothetical protein [Amycolatopsis sp. FDAARGOS 1241]